MDGTAGPEGRPKLELTFRQKTNAQYASVIELAFSVRWGRPPTDAERAEFLEVASELTGRQVDLISGWLAGKD